MSSDQSTGSASMIDPIDSMLDFSEYDNTNTFHSPSLSPSTSKGNFARATTTAATPASLLSTTQPMSGPSHQYDQYKQQTGFVPGAIANTFAVNQNSQIGGYGSYGSMDYLGISQTEDSFDFNNISSQDMTSPDMDLVDFDSPAETNFFFPESTVNPSAIGGQDSQATVPSPSTLSPQPSNVGRLWPGMHQQAALAKARAQQQQQQQIIQQQRQTAQQGKARAKGPQPSDPIVEQKITQLLNSMRAKPSSPDSAHSQSGSNLPRMKKDEEDMDEDERLLASEEGKKLSSKERRQLRNKVSARAFRSRRKEYITQLEAEIANKVNENGDLKTQNRALMEENKRLSDLTRMLLGSPSFSNFLEHLSTNLDSVTQPQPTPVQMKQERPAPKDINPYAAQQNQQQQIGMVMLPEQNMDLSMLTLDNTQAGFNFQPQVFAVSEIDVPTIDTSMLSGKASNFVGNLNSEEEKREMPVIDRPAEKKMEPKLNVAPVPVDEEFENDDTFALYHESSTAVEAEETESSMAPRELNTEAMSMIDIFGGIAPEKALAHYHLADATEDERRQAEDALAVARTDRIIANLEAISSRLEMLSFD